MRDCRVGMGIRIFEQKFMRSSQLLKPSRIWLFKMLSHADEISLPMWIVMHS